MGSRLVPLLLAFCLSTPATAQSVEEYKFVVHLMNRLQGPSFAQSREYCGFVIRDPRGKITSGQISPGTADRCGPIRPDTGEVLSSFHTHGGYTEVHYNEVPSVIDLRGDIATQTNGWISTPGGRLWFNDWQRGVARQMCGVGCLKQDPDFVAGTHGKVEQVYTLDKLIRLMGP